MTDQINKLQAELDQLSERIADTQQVTSNGLVELTRVFREKQEKLDAMKDALAELAKQKWQQHNSTLTNAEIEQEQGIRHYPADARNAKGMINLSPDQDIHLNQNNI